MNISQIPDTTIEMREKLEEMLGLCVSDDAEPYSAEYLAAAVLSELWKMTGELSERLEQIAEAASSIRGI